jgi:hypothetical protein
MAATDGTERIQTQVGQTSSSTAAQPASKPTFICDFCGPSRPAEEVFECTLCIKKYCVKHLAPMAHYCFGALGKPQSVGVSS